MNELRAFSILFKHACSSTASVIQGKMLVLVDLTSLAHKAKKKTNYNLFGPAKIELDKITSILMPNWLQTERNVNLMSILKTKTTCKQNHTRAINSKKCSRSLPCTPRVTRCRTCRDARRTPSAAA
ncbi:unnamed protein product [Ixodes pacificus]